MLSKLLKQKGQELGLSSRQIAEKVGVSHATILRALKGETVDVKTIIKLSEWLQVKPHTLLNSMGSTRDSLAEKIAVMLEGNPSLTAAFKKAIDAIVDGNVEPSVIEDIAAYIAFQIKIKDISK